MKICLENVNLSSLSGPNSFANKLSKYFSFDGHEITVAEKADVSLCFIEYHRNKKITPLFQRLDGIYFNKAQDFVKQNANIKRTYDLADGVIFQTEFNKRLTYEYFGTLSNAVVISNGADVELIERVSPLKHTKLSKYRNIWCCAANWRPHKRLKQNIKYFLEHSMEDECLVIAGKKHEEIMKNERIFYVGEIPHEQLISLYKASKYFLHLAWLDHCPNVVVDARASGCKIICSSTGGTKEIAGPQATLIEEEEWDYKPIDLYNPPDLNFEKKLNNYYDIEYNMYDVSRRNLEFLSSYAGGGK